MGQIDPLLKDKLLAVIPVYNHPETVRFIAEALLDAGLEVLVVDDGSTSETGPLLQGLDLEIIRHSRNMGKGRAILTGADFARSRGKTHILTIDADGQHPPQETVKLIAEMEKDPLAVVIGARKFPEKNVPGASRFGRSFSNFWLRVQTGARVSDVQSGFRIYPVILLTTLKTREKGYAFEVEILVRALWAGFNVREVPVEVHYPSPEKRISHFDKFRDNLRISFLNTRLTTRAMLPIPHRQYAADSEQNITPLHPLKSLHLLLEKENTPLKLSLSGGLGVFIGALPIFGLHYISVMLVTGFFRLNKITALATNQLCMPPLVPALCIETGYFLRHGEFLTEVSLQTLGKEGLYRLWEWLLGSLVLGPIFFVLIFSLTFALSKLVQKRLLASK
ncbi:MAG: DUF2062 domain-containing protein [Desulfonatronovibrionaceae bacterium]